MRTCSLYALLQSGVVGVQAQPVPECLHQRWTNLRVTGCLWRAGETRGLGYVTCTFAASALLGWQAMQTHERCSVQHPPVDF